MRIAIDLDGVVFNTDMFFMAMGEYYDCKYLRSNNLVQPDEARVQEKYNWNNSEILEYINRYSCVEDFELMPGANLVINEIKNNKNNEIYFVSARGQFSTKEIEIAMNKLKENGLEADKCFWCCKDKVDLCLKENIDIIIDDDFRINDALKDSNVIFIHFHMAGKRKPKSRKGLYKVHNWGEIFRVLNMLDIVNV